MNDERWTELLVELKDQCAATMTMVTAGIESGRNLNNAFDEVFSQAVSRLTRSDEYAGTDVTDSYVGFGIRLVNGFSGAKHGISYCGFLLHDVATITAFLTAYAVTYDIWSTYASADDRTALYGYVGDEVKRLLEFSGEHQLQRFSI